MANIPIIARLKNYGRDGMRVPVRGVEVNELLQPYCRLGELLPNSTSAAIEEPLSNERKPLTHSQLRKFALEEFDLNTFGIKDGSRVSILLPNGPELAVAIISVMSRWCAAPINPTSTWQEIKAELDSTRSTAIIILAGASTNEAALQAANAAGLGVLVITPDPSITGIFRISQLVQTMKMNSSSTVPSKSDVVMLLHTSGTSGNKKLVPYTLEMIVVGVGCIVSSWNLSPSDICLNMMPLFHIGGIVRNILSPILSGGSVITCSGFDPILFWDVLYSKNDRRFTWYYAAPTMHHAILQEAEKRPKPLPVRSVRFLANAAGGLLPVLAENLRTTFQATILTSYGMTECMPISSPPQDYKLNPIGTSGTPVGPDVIIVDDSNVPVPFGTRGNIMVKGVPCFGGYENSSSANSESFFIINGEKWFNTGDMGSLDENMYLFISGRSKEIINRGGETISPFEIEEAIVQHPNVKETLAFSAPHAKYQETVGAIIVTKPSCPRVDLPSLHKYLEKHLHRSKWPQILIFMDALPKNATGKILRIRFAERANIKEVDEESSPLLRMFSGICPKQGTPLQEPILISPIEADAGTTERFLSSQKGVQAAAVVRVDLPFRLDAFVGFVVIDTKEEHSRSPLTIGTVSPATSISLLEDACSKMLDAYLVPAFIIEIPDIPKISNSKIDREALMRLALTSFAERNVIVPRNAIESQIEAVWREQLGSTSVISVKDSFFDIGGDSLSAGQLIHAMRKKLQIQLSVADLFTASTIEALAFKVSTMKTLGSPGMSSARDLKLKNIRKNKADPSESDSYWTWDSMTSLSNTSWGCLIIQSLPLLVIYPARRISTWFLIAAPWVYLMSLGYGRFVSLVAAMLIARLATGLLAPIVAVLCKWIIIGKYRPGKYPLWSSMYLKWWLVEQIINIMGKGYYRDDIPIIGQPLTRIYYRLMGAKIGKNVRIHRDAKLGQFDLLSIGDDVTIDNAVVRAFALEEGHFVLLPIVIGARSSVAVKCAIAPGSELPEDTCLGPLSSSHEIDDARVQYRQYCRTAFQAPPTALVLFIGIPILLFVNILALVPWYLSLQVMVSHAKLSGWYKSNLRTIFDAFLWWITPQRLCYYFLLRIVRRCVVPFIRLGITICIKWVLIGKFTPLDEREKRKPWNTFRYWLMSRLLAGGNLAGVSRLVGSHYEVISIIYRLLGSKIGKRVYWPGSGLDIVEYDLLEIGDDVVFGSRSVIMTSSSIRSAKVTLEAGCMVADRCVVLPGARLCRGSVLGSGSLAKENFVAEVGSVWVGSRDGCAVQASPADTTYAAKDTITPFGRAFYLHDAPYTVIPLWAISLYNVIWQGFCTCYRNSYVALSLIICNYLLELDQYDQHPPIKLFQLTMVSIVPLHLVMSISALAFDIASKWVLLGRRKQGVYSWDQSSYCQRWQIYLTLQEIRRSERHKTGLLDLIKGSQYLVWYFRLLGCRIGENVCLYPNGGDPMMTEPDLCEIGDRASVDDSSLIAHINTRGVFRLNPVRVGQGCVLKSMTRLLSGATMEAHSIMLEHTLVLAGESVDSGSVWQGWPSNNQSSLDSYRESLRRELDQCLRRELMLNKRKPISSLYTSISTDDNENSTNDIEMHTKKPKSVATIGKARNSQAHGLKAGQEKIPLLGDKTSRSDKHRYSGYGSS